MISTMETAMESMEIGELVILALETMLVSLCMKLSLIHILWTCVPMPDRGLILSLLSMRGLLSSRWKSVVSRQISAT